MAVVIVNLNGGELVRRTVTSLRAQTLAPARVIVVDNASTDGSADGLDDLYPGLELVRSEQNLGFAAANNLAVHRAGDCEWIALLNPDAFPEPAGSRLSSTPRAPGPSTASSAAASFVPTTRPSSTGLETPST